MFKSFCIVTGGVSRGNRQVISIIKHNLSEMAEVKERMQIQRYWLTGLANFLAINFGQDPTCHPFINLASVLGRNKYGKSVGGVVLVLRNLPKNNRRSRKNTYFVYKKVVNIPKIKLVYEG